MIRMLVFTAGKKEMQLIGSTVKNRAALLTDDRWEIISCLTRAQVQAAIEKGDTIDTVCFDVAAHGSIPLLEELRGKYQKAYIILIAGMEISPVTYMKPTIMASSLLLRPLKEERVGEAVEMMLEAFKREEQSDDEVLVLEDQDGRVRVICRDIAYFEAREKKIYACTDTREYGFYDTLEQLNERLPDYFLRVHRSYIVNCNKIQKVALSEGLIYLEDDGIVPLSRSYRPIVRQLRQEGRIR